MGLVHSPKIVTDGLVLALDAGNVKSYPGSGTTWYDKSGNGNNGTLTNGPTFATGSIVFDGVDDYVNLGTSLNVTTGQVYTVCMWIYKTDIKANNAAFIISGGYGGDQDGITLGTNDYSSPSPTESKLVGGNSYIFDNIYYNGNAIPFTDNIADTAFNLNEWIFISTIGTVISEDGGQHWIAANNNNTNHFTGNIATTQIYNRALSSQEVLQNYNATKSRFGL